MNRLIILSLFCIVVIAQRPVITFGRSYEGSGVYQFEGAGTFNGLNFWAEWINNHTGLVINDTAYNVAFKQYNDGSDVDTTYLIYEKLNTLNLPLLFGPWTTQLTGPALKATNNSINQTPFMFTGASSPAYYNSGYKFAFGTLVTSGKRSLPCIQYFVTQNVKTATIIASTDAFQQVTYPLLMQQLLNNNITLVYNATVSLTGTDDLTLHLKTIDALKPDIIICAMESPSYIPFITELRKNKEWQPKAILITNAATSIKAYNTEGWAFDGVFAGDQWSPLFEYTDPWFGSNSNFVDLFIQRYNYTPTFVEASAVIGGFIVGDAIQRAGSLLSQDIITAIASTIFNETFYGPIQFKSNGELTAPTICEQVLPPPNITRRETKLRKNYIVFPLTVANQPAIYPVEVIRPLGPKITKVQWVGVGFGIAVGTILIIALIVLLVVFIIKKKFHLIWIPKNEFENKEEEEWTSNK